VVKLPTACGGLSKHKPLVCGTLDWLKVVSLKIGSPRRSAGRQRRHDLTKQGAIPQILSLLLATSDSDLIGLQIRRRSLNSVEQASVGYISDWES